MTHREAVRQFRTQFHVLYERRVDYWTGQLAWSGFVDGLCKAGQITQRQYNTWKTPFKYGRHLKATKRYSR